MATDAITQAAEASLALAAAGEPKTWSDPDEARLKHEQVWNPGQVQAGYRYLLRKAERDVLS